MWIGGVYVFDSIERQVAICKVLKRQGIVKNIDNLSEDEAVKILNCIEMIDGFLTPLKNMTEFYKKSHFDILKRIFSRKRNVEYKLMEALVKDLREIYNYIADNNLKDDRISWRKYGYFLYGAYFNHKKSLISPKVIDLLTKKLQYINNVVLIKLNDVYTVVLQKQAEKLTQYELVRKNFARNLWFSTRLHYEQTLEKQKDNLFKYPKRIEKDVAKFCKSKIKEIFDHIYANNLKPKNIGWEKLGEYLWLILYHPYQVDMIDLPKELIEYIRNTFEWKRITVRKVEETYTIVFADSSC